MRRKVYAYLGIVGLFACVTAVALLQPAPPPVLLTPQAREFFETALNQARVYEEVLVAGEHYAVSNGEVLLASSTDLTPEEITSNALRLAYAKAVLRRSPLLTLEGVDLNTLQEAIYKLEVIAGELALHADGPANRTRIRETLFPTDFLRLLVEAERARDAFLTNGSEEDLERYSSALTKATLRGEEQASQLESLIETIVPGNHFYGFAEGVIGGSNMVQSLEAIQNALAQVREEQAKRQQCVRGVVEACDSKDLAVTLAAEPSSEERGGLAQARTVLFFLNQNGDLNMESSLGPLIGLSQSSCTNSRPKPHYFTMLSHLPQEGTGGPSLMPQYVGDIFFTPPDITQSVPDLQIYKHYGISYVKLDPTAFYICPRIADDVGRVYAVRAVADFAFLHPEFAQEAAAHLTNQTAIYEIDAAAYLTEAWGYVENRPDLSFQTKHELISLATMWREKSAGFGAEVANIGSIMGALVGLLKADLPIADANLENLFINHTAFFGLYLGNQLEKIVPIELFAETEVEFYENYVSFTYDLKPIMTPALEAEVGQSLYNLVQLHLYPDTAKAQNP